jgi:hypothetical protein
MFDPTTLTELPQSQLVQITDTFKTPNDALLIIFNHCISVLSFLSCD